MAGSGRARRRARSEGVIDEGDERARVQTSWRGNKIGEVEEAMVCWIEQVKVNDAGRADCCRRNSKRRETFEQFLVHRYDIKRISLIFSCLAGQVPF